MNRQRVLAWCLLIGTTVASVQAGRAIQAREQARLPILQQQAKTRGGAQPILDIVEFSDFQCPACGQAFLVFHPLLEKYPTQLRLSFRQHPFEKPHRWALTAAIASECAARQGKFWPFHDLLFRLQPQWSQGEDAVTLLKIYARQLQMHGPSFDRCLDQQQTLEAVRADQQVGSVWQVSSTPTLIINGQERIVGSKMLLEALPLLEARLQGQTPPSPGKQP